MKISRYQNRLLKQDKKRLRFLGWLFSFFMILVLVRTFWFQVIHRDHWSKYGPMQYQRYQVLRAVRGVIFDRNHHILAMDLPLLSLAIDPGMIKSKATFADTLSKILGKSSEIYLEILKRPKRFVWLEKDITDYQKLQLDSCKVSGLIYVEDRVRSHPYETLALPVLGITNKKHEGVGGIEQAYEDDLRGEDGWGTFLRDGFDKYLTNLDFSVEKQNNGKHLVLTLDQAYQTIVEEELGRGIHKFRAKSGSAVLMDPFSGEIHAMASLVSNRRGKASKNIDEVLLNRTLQYAYEPGSTFKIVPAAAAIEEGVYKASTLIHCENGAYEYAGQTIHDDNREFSWLTLSEVIQKSSNIGMVKISNKLGDRTFFQYMQNFGFGNTTGIHFPNESVGTLRPVYEWSDLSLASLAFGQEISVNSVQLACMLSVIANGGNLIQARLVQAIQDENGKVIETYPKDILRQVISENTASIMRDILTYSVEKGIASEAAVPGIRVAGKTGTAQKTVKDVVGYIPGIYTSSFIGFWPAETPEFVLVISLDEPGTFHSGSKTAAPIFSNIVRRMVGLNIVPEQTVPEMAEKKSFLFSSLQNTEIETVPQNTHKKLNKNHVPDMTGMSVRNALNMLSQAGLTATIDGYGLIVSQTPESGTPIQPGMSCHLICQQQEGDNLL